MNIPSVWPSPHNDQTRIRVFRIEIERPEGAIGQPDPAPVFSAHVQEAFEIGGTPFRQHRPELMLRMDFESMLKDEDEELAQAARRCAADLEAISYILYSRKAKACSPDAV